jgi:hypothetical protein
MIRLGSRHLADKLVQRMVTAAGGPAKPAREVAGSSAGGRFHKRMAVQVMGPVSPSDERRCAACHPLTELMVTGP